jgi:hypothetical protein
MYVLNCLYQLYLSIFVCITAMAFSKHELFKYSNGRGQRVSLISVSTHVQIDTD